MPDGLKHGSYDAFVTKINANGNALVYSTYLGGSGADVGRGIALDAAGNAYLTGYTTSTARHPLVMAGLMGSSLTESR